MGRSTSVATADSMHVCAVAARLVFAQDVSLSDNLQSLLTLGVKLQTFMSKELRLGHRLSLVIMEAEALHSVSVAQTFFELMFVALFLGLLSQYTYLGQHIRSILIKHNFTMALATRLLVQTQLFTEQQQQPMQEGQIPRRPKEQNIELRIAEVLKTLVTVQDVAGSERGPSGGHAAQDRRMSVLIGPTGANVSDEVDENTTNDLT
jgi:hypothetical protein